MKNQNITLNIKMNHPSVPTKTVRRASKPRTKKARSVMSDGGFLRERRNNTYFDSR